MRSTRSPGARTPTSGVLMEALFAVTVLAGAAVSALAVALGRPRGASDDAERERAIEEAARDER